MPPVKLSRIVYVPDTPSDKDPGEKGGVDLGAGQVVLPAGSRHCAVDNAVLGSFLDAIKARNIPMEDALELALKLYLKRLQSVVK